jgi:hypothetical protein
MTERCGVRSPHIGLPCRKIVGHTRDHSCGPFGWVNWSQPLPSSSNDGLVYQQPEAERLRWPAIRCALYYGLAPSRFYEDSPHYAPMPYWAHLGMNLAYAWRWFTGQQTEADLQFERETNAAPSEPEEGS